MNRKQKMALMSVVSSMDLWENSSSSSSSSSSSDYEDNVLLVLCNLLLFNEEIPNRDKSVTEIPRIRDFVDHVLPGYSDFTFKEHFRMFPDTFDIVLAVIGPIVQRHSSPGRPAIDPRKQLLLTLWFMATFDSLSSVATQFRVGKATAYRIVRRVTHALQCCSKQFIHWPETPEAAERIVHTFAASKGFPGVIGAVDQWHIRIRAQKEKAGSYFNKEGHHSITLQGVCDARGMFTHCHIAPAGPYHHAHVFINSPIAQFLTLPNAYFPNNTHLIGDVAYPIHPHVMVPFRENGILTRQQKNFNYRLLSTRMAIERAFGLMKSRFRILLHSLPLTNFKKIPELVIACCVLHNICLTQDDVFPYNEENVPTPPPAEEVWDAAESGVNKRNSIMNGFSTASLT